MPVVEVENGATDEAHPELFDIRAMLPQPKDKKPGQISDALIRKFFEDVSCRGFFLFLVFAGCIVYIVMKLISCTRVVRKVRGQPGYY